MRPTLQSIFSVAYSAYRSAYWQPDYINKTAWNIMNCRAARLGGHLQVCPDGHFQRNHYNSCGDRVCPQCAFLRIQRWYSKQRERLLACDHYHIIMTVPHELIPLWRLNPRSMAAIYFRAARETLLRFWVMRNSWEPGQASLQRSTPAQKLWRCIRMFIAL